MFSLYIMRRTGSWGEQLLLGTENPFPKFLKNASCYLTTESPSTVQLELIDIETSVNCPNNKSNAFMGNYVFSTFPLKREQGTVLHLFLTGYLGMGALAVLTILLFKLLLNVQWFFSSSTSWVLMSQHTVAGPSLKHCVKWVRSKVVVEVQGRRLLWEGMSPWQEESRYSDSMGLN